MRAMSKWRGPAETPGSTLDIAMRQRNLVRPRAAARELRVEPEVVVNLMRSKSVRTELVEHKGHTYEGIPRATLDALLAAQASQGIARL